MGIRRIPSRWHGVSPVSACAVRSLLDGLPLFLRGQISIPDHPQLIRELRLLERRAARSGKDSVDHGVGGHDDHANGLFGAMHLATSKRNQVPTFGPIITTSSGYTTPVGVWAGSKAGTGSRLTPEQQAQRRREAYEASMMDATHREASGDRDCSYTARYERNWRTD